MSDFENKLKEYKLPYGVVPQIQPRNVRGLIDMGTLYHLAMLIGEELIEQQKRLDKLEGGEY